MPLVAMNDYMDGIEDLRLAMGYGLPKSYPLALNGMGADDGGAALGPFAYTPSSAAPFSPGNPGIQVNPAATTFMPSGQTNPQPGSPFAQKVGTVTDALTKIFASFAPALQKQPKNNVVIQKEPDYTTYAVIGGAVIVASVLAIAVGKSGRKRD